MAGIEPARPKTPDSKSGASANSATPATQLSCKFLENYNGFIKICLSKNLFLSINFPKNKGLLIAASKKSAIQILFENYTKEVVFMITPELLARINELARKKRTKGLSEEEKAEQKMLYEIYLSSIRGQVINLLDSIKIVDETGEVQGKSKKKKILHQTTLNLEQVYH